jgi:hypothetical protein
MRHTFLSICCLLTVNLAAAQFSIYGAAGMSGLKYKAEKGNVSPEPGYGGGVGYAISMSSSWKAGLAAEFTMFNSKASFGAFSGRYEQGTGEGRSLFSYALKDYTETQSISMVSIPVTVQYQTTGRVRFCLAGGAKLGLPVIAQANISPGTVNASGEYEHEGQRYTNLPQHGFPEGTKLPETKRNIELQYSVAATFETGLLIRMFYLGAYLDYGLTDMQKTKDKHPLEYRNSSTLVHNSILNTDLVENINLFSVGLKIKIQFSKNSNQMSVIKAKYQ